MMTRDGIIGRLEAFFVRELLEGQNIGLTADTPLLQQGLIDSVSIVMLSDFIEREFEIEIESTELTTQHLSSLRSIADLIMMKATPASSER